MRPSCVAGDISTSGDPPFSAPHNQLICQKESWPFPWLAIVKTTISRVYYNKQCSLKGKVFFCAKVSKERIWFVTESF